MAQPFLRTRLPSPAQTVRVLYTDEPEPHAPDLVLKTVPVRNVAVLQDKRWRNGTAGRLLQIPLALEEIRPKRRFAVDVVLVGQRSALVGGGTVPAQLVDANGDLFRDALGRRFIPAPAV